MLLQCDWLKGHGVSPATSYGLLSLRWSCTRAASYSAAQGGSENFAEVVIMWHWQYSCWWLYWRLPGHAPGSSRSPAEPIRHCSPGLWCPSRTWQVQEEITLFTLMEGEQESSWEDKRTEEIGWGVRRLKRGWNEEGKGKFWEQAGRSDNDPACSDLCLQLASPQHSVYIGYNINPVYKWLSDLCN